MFENIIVIAILLLCLYLVGRRFIRQFKSTETEGGASSGCGCDCSNCPSIKTQDILKDT